MIHRLPTEIWYHVASALAEYGTKSIFPLIFTCHAFRQLAELIFYRHVDTRLMWDEQRFLNRLHPDLEGSVERFGLLYDYLGERIASLVQTLVDAPRLARHVRELNVHCDPAPNAIHLIGPMFVGLINLQSLSVSSQITGNICVSLPSWVFRLDFLKWNLTDPMSPELVNFLAIQSSLQSIELACHSFLSLPSDALPNLNRVTVSPLGLVSLLTGRSVPSLVVLSYASSDGLPDMEWACLGPSLRRLKQLRLRNVFHDDLPGMARYLENLQRLILDTSAFEDISSIFCVRSLVHLKFRRFTLPAMMYVQSGETNDMDALFQRLSSLRAVDVEVKDDEFHRFVRERTAEPVTINNDLLSTWLLE